MAQRITVDGLIEEVRQQLSETNRVLVSDENDIIPALNRAQNFAVDILARKYKEPLVTFKLINTVAGSGNYPIPEDALEQRLLKVEVKTVGAFNEVQFIDFQDIGLFEVETTTSSIPYYYTTMGDQIKILPKSSGAYQLRLWYLLEPLPLTPSQGRINILNTASNYVIVDSIGSSITTTADDLTSFVSIIDGASGKRKGTMQVQAISGNKVTFKTVPTRSIVLDLPVDTSLATLASNLVPEVDDYLCLSTGTCVPFLKKPLANFLVQFSVAELTRKIIGSDADLEEKVLIKFEQQVERAWVQRPNGTRVRKRNKNWSIPVRRILGQ